MVSGRLKLLTRLAGRIRVEEYAAQVNEIMSKIQSLVSNQDVNLLPMPYSLGSVNFTLNDKIVTLNIVLNPKQKMAGLFWPPNAGRNPQLIINPQILMDQKNNLSGQIKPLIDHEITHLLDLSYNPIYERSEKLNSLFVKEYFTLLQQSIDVPKTLNKLKSVSIEQLVRQHFFKLTNSSVFKKMLDKYQISLDDFLTRKLIKLTEDFYIDYTPIKSQSVYFNSELEVRAYINQIISNLQISLDKPNGQKILSKIVNDTMSISSLTEDILQRSKLFQEIKQFLTQKNVRKFYTEIARFLTNKADQFEKSNKTTIHS